MLFSKLCVLTTVALATVAESARMLNQPSGGGGGLTPDCQKELDTLNDPAVQETAAKCEQEGKYPEKVVTALQKADEATAIGHAEQMFVKCAKFSETCAKEVAPGLVMKVRFSGAAVSESCMQEALKAQNDPELKDYTAKCEAEQKLGEKILTALNKNDINGAMGAAELGLEKCMKMSKDCAYQVAPVIVNSVVMQAMQAQQQQQQIPETVVLAERAVPADKAGVMVLGTKLSPPVALQSLFHFFKPASKAPVARKASKGAVLLQQGAHRVWVSRLLVQLAAQRF